MRQPTVPGQAGDCRLRRSGRRPAGVCEQKENLDIDNCDHYETRHILQLLNILSNDYVNEYSKWISVGLALYNSGDFLDQWDEWSKKSNMDRIIIHIIKSSCH